MSMKLYQRKELLFMLVKYVLIDSLYPIYVINNPAVSLYTFNIVVLAIYIFMVYNLRIIILTLMDLISNTNHGTDDQLIKLEFKYTPRGEYYYAIFERSNKLIINEQQYTDLIEKQMYRIVYSRWTRKLWDSQLIDYQD